MLPARCRVFAGSMLAAVFLAGQFVAGSLLTGVAFAGNWPTFGGNSQRNGQSVDTGPTGPDILWQGSAVNALFGGQCYIDGDRLATMRFQTINVSPIVCYDLYGGEQLWSVDFPGTNSRSVPRGMRDGKVYATNFQETGNDTLYALDANTGAQLWTADVFCERGIIWGAVFAPNGDLVVPITSNHIARVDQTDGSTVWQTARIIPNTGAESLVIFGNTLYGFEGTITTPKMLTAWDLDTGVKKYSSPGLPGDGDQEVPLTAGPDGTLYVKRDGGAFYAFTDTGSALEELWHIANGNVPYSGHFGVGTDGSIYIPSGTTLVRLDPSDGAVLDTSPPLVTSSTLNPRFAIDANGTLFVGNSGSGDGALYAMDPSLNILWQVPVPSMVYGGPALGSTGTLAVAGSGSILRVYRSNTVSAPEVTWTGGDLQVWPNPFRSQARLGFRLTEAGPVSIAAYDAAGRLVEVVSDQVMGAGSHQLEWNPLRSPGEGARALFLRMETGSHAAAVKAIQIR
ncbi:MAG: PQQ-binding-like beta-propeller repeat protein [Candidatus Eisenbacteria bacterium]